MGVNTITILIAFVTTPMLVRWLGVEHFGMIRTLMDYFAVLSLLDLGVSRVASIMLAEAVASRDQLRIAQAIRASLLVMTKVTGVLLTGGVILILIVPKLAGTLSIPAGDLRLAATILMLPICLVPFSVARGLFEARQSGYIINVLLVLQAIATTLLSLLFASRGSGLVGQAAALVIPQAAFVLVTASALVLSPAPWRTTQCPPELAARFWRLNWQVFGNNAANRVSLFSDNIIIAALLSPALVTPFYLTQRIAAIVQAQLLSIPGATWVGLLEMFRQGQGPAFRERLIELTELVSSLAGVAAAVIVSFNAAFIARWVGPSSYAGDTLTTLAVLSLWFSVVSGMWTWLVGGLGEIGRWLPYSIASAVLNIVVSLVATKALGIYGPLLGTVSAFVLIHTWALPRVMATLFPVTRGDLWVAALRPLMWVAPFAVAIHWFAADRQFDSWLTLVSCMCAAGLAGMLLWLTFGLNTDQRARWRQRVWSAIGAPALPVLVPLQRR